MVWASFVMASRAASAAVRALEASVPAWSATCAALCAASSASVAFSSAASRCFRCSSGGLAVLVGLLLHRMGIVDHLLHHGVDNRAGPAPGSVSWILRIAAALYSGLSGTV